MFTSMSFLDTKDKDYAELKKSKKQPERNLMKSPKQ